MANMSMAAPVKRRLRQPRVAEIVADSLRARILSGQLGDGDQLPKQEEMIAEFGVSPPCVREALRILETEGLVTVLRGNVGGATVHVPQPVTAAYMMGLVLQSRSVPLSDLVGALRAIEPACAAYCAARADRHETVLPILRANVAQSREAVDDPGVFIGMARDFHVQLVALCGNATMSLVVGALEALWSAQVNTFARNAQQHGTFADRAIRMSVADEHERICQIIANGDVRGAEQAMHEHFSEDREDRRHGFDQEATVIATALRDWSVEAARRL